MLLALPAYSVTPEYAARFFNSINDFAPGRIDLNLVAGNLSTIKENFIIDHYPGDVLTINSHDKRVSLTEPWMKKFVNLVKHYKIKTNTFVVGGSETTIRVATNSTDYLIVFDHNNNQNIFNKVKNNKLMLTIEPVVLNPGESFDMVEYFKTPASFRSNIISGTEDEIIDKIITISKNFGISDFLIVTYQKDISRIFSVIDKFKHYGV